MSEFVGHAVAYMLCAEIVWRATICQKDFDFCQISLIDLGKVVVCCIVLLVLFSIKTLQILTDSRRNSRTVGINRAFFQQSSGCLYSYIRYSR